MTENISEISCDWSDVQQVGIHGFARLHDTLIWVTKWEALCRALSTLAPGPTENLPAAGALFAEQSFLRWSGPPTPLSLDLVFALVRATGAQRIHVFGDLSPTALASYLLLRDRLAVSGATAIGGAPISNSANAIGGAPQSNSVHVEWRGAGGKLLTFAGDSLRSEGNAFTEVSSAIPFFADEGVLWRAIQRRWPDDIAALPAEDFALLQRGRALHIDPLLSFENFTPEYPLALLEHVCRP